MTAPPPLPPARRPSIPVGPRSPEPAARAPSLPYPSGQPAVPTGYNAEPLVAEEAPRELFAPLSRLNVPSDSSLRLAAPPSNLARRASIQLSSTPSPVDPEATKEEEPSEQDEEATRRQTIAARFVFVAFRSAVPELTSLSFPCLPAEWPS